MADNRYRNNQHINRHRPLALNLSNPNHPLNHGWTFSHWNKQHNQAVYIQSDIKLMFYDFHNCWLVQFPDSDYPSRKEGTMEDITEDALKEE